MSSPGKRTRVDLPPGLRETKRGIVRDLDDTLDPDRPTMNPIDDSPELDASLFYPFLHLLRHTPTRSDDLER
jgi:hypothetical protein